MWCSSLRRLTVGVSSIRYCAAVILLLLQCRVVAMSASDDKVVSLGDLSVLDAEAKLMVRYITS